MRVIERRRQIPLIEPAHQRQIVHTDRLGAPTQRRARHPQQMVLHHDRQISVRPINQSQPRYRLHGSGLLRKTPLNCQLAELLIQLRKSYILHRRSIHSARLARVTRLAPRKQRPSPLPEPPSSIHGSDWHARHTGSTAPPPSRPHKPPPAPPSPGRLRGAVCEYSSSVTPGPQTV